MSSIHLGLRGSRFILVFMALLTLASTARAAEMPSDPFLWLEDVEGERSLNWVKQQNTQTVGDLEAHPHFKTIQGEIRNLVFAKDRVPFSSFYKGFFWNFWQDETYKHGVLRRTTLAEYKKDLPSWETILDLDALSKAENENWVYKGSDRLDKDSPRTLLHLSRGGKDAIVLREFDYDKRQFVEGGFYVPEAKSQAAPLDQDQVLIGTDFGEGSLTDSGYPRIFKLWTRGQPLSEARTVFEVKTSDLSAGAGQLRDGKLKYVLFYRMIDFFNSEVFLQQADLSLRKLPLPTSASFLSIKNQYVYVQLKENLDLGNRRIPLNSVIRFGIQDESLSNAQVIFTANQKQSIQGVSISKDHVFVSLLDNIRSKVLDFQVEGDEWKNTVLSFPNTGVISFDLKDEDEPADITTMSYTDHLTPSSQYWVHDEDGSYHLELLKSAPARFEASKFEVIQNFATSRDGTQVPYFLMKRKDLVADGSHPTILYGYGGFEVPLAPSYSGTIGKVWLERGGVYVIANIRGGGEFGPEWHQAATKEHRQRAFDDFISVAEDLIARRITSPLHLGIQGGSNGGLLVGATMIQRPELFNAVLAQVPLLDMARYSKLLAGASWKGEYGDPDDPKELDYLLAYSPYHNVKAGQRYPKPMFTTSTKDDRVHPGHARKMSARMAEQGHSFYYYENINGGHAGSANLEEMAYMSALEYTYFWSRL